MYNSLDRRSLSSTCSSKYFCNATVDHCKANSWWTVSKHLLLIMKHSSTEKKKQFDGTMGHILRYVDMSEWVYCFLQQRLLFVDTPWNTPFAIEPASIWYTCWRLIVESITPVISPSVGQVKWFIFFKSDRKPVKNRTKERTIGLHTCTW